MNRSEELIPILVADLKPVRRLPDPATRAVRWACLALVCVGLGAYALGTRPDLVHRLSDASCVAESTALFVLFASAAWSAFALSVPGIEVVAFKRAFPALALLAWLLLVASRSPAGGLSISLDLRCVWRMLGLELAPAAVALFMLRKAAPGNRGRTGLLALLSVGALGALGTQAVCAKDDPGHVLLWHAAPLIVTALLGIVAGACLLRRGSTSPDSLLSGRVLRDPA